MSMFPLRQPVLARDAAHLATSLRLYPSRVCRLVVIVPALNEERTIGDVVRRIPRQIEGIASVDVVVVDDGSTDHTAAIARAGGAIVVSHPRACGVGAAFQTGLRKAFSLGADLVLNIDGDGQFLPEDIPKLVAPILADEVDFVTASRFADPQRVPEMTWVKRWGNRQISRLVSWLVGAKFHDVSCGMRAYGREAMLNLSLIEPFTYTHETFLHLMSKRMRAAEVPVVVRGQREFGRSRVAGNLCRYATNAAAIIFRFYRDYYPLKFFGWISSICLAVAAPLLLFLSWHYCSTGHFAPHKWAGFAGAAMGCCSIGSLFMGILGDMLKRQQMCLEEIRYHMRSLVMSAQPRTAQHRDSA